jgi:hypothetical protein
MDRQLGATIELPAAIRTVMQRRLDSGWAKFGGEVNCGDFIQPIYAELGGMLRTYELGIDEFGIQGLLNFNPDEGVSDVGAPFDREIIAAHWPKIAPPAGLSWDDMDRLSVDAGLCSGTHVWMVLDGRHYDCECPDGVENPFELPFFQRVIASWKAKAPSRQRVARPEDVMLS